MFSLQIQCNKFSRFEWTLPLRIIQPPETCHCYPLLHIQTTTVLLLNAISPFLCENTIKPQPTNQPNPIADVDTVSTFKACCGTAASAGWQVTLCDPIWHAGSRTGVVLVAQTVICFPYLFLYLYVLNAVRC